MNRFYWSDTSPALGEVHITQQVGVALYDGADKTSCLCLPLPLVVYLEEQPSGFAKSAKIVVHLTAPEPGQTSGPVASSKFDYIRLSFRDSGQSEFMRYFTQAIKDQKWKEKVLPPGQAGVTAKDMVALSKTIVNKIKDKQGDITEDETVKFKAYLLSMGIPNPVTRETHGTGDRLLLTEREGGVCRDDSEEGLRFYPNHFLTTT
ncbi:VPS36-like protein [Mya arenaria]|uniref:Vacuolar protein-sorting-associated protein 36 n=1 Tax=Mya arenaria TaxID=6604 RepID=A0ABY7DNQ5_MYAAR|nr:VPS36-like protein [Mya arenaria]